MSRAGRKGKYDPEQTPKLAEQYASELLTDAQIYAKLGISYETFYKWLKKHVEFAEAIKRGKEAANRDLVEVMKKSAKGYYVDEEETVVYLDRNKRPKSYSKTVKHRYIAPSTTTQIFLAKNRMPEDYRDRHDVDVRGKLEVSTLADLMMEEFKDESGEKEAAIIERAESGDD